MFCGYLRTVADNDPKAGDNAGQMEYGFSGKSLPWTRRDCVIEIPDGYHVRYLALQLHKATGVVWVDNVRLVKLNRETKQDVGSQE